MGVIQNSVNTALGITAASGVALNKAIEPAISDAQTHLSEVNEAEENELVKADQKIDEANFQKQLATKELENPSPGNTKPEVLRKFDVSKAQESVVAAQKAKSELETRVRLAKATREGYKFDSRVGLIRKMIDANKAINTNPQKLKEANK